MLDNQHETNVDINDHPINLPTNNPTYRTTRLGICILRPSFIAPTRQALEAVPQTAGLSFPLLDAMVISQEHLHCLPSMDSTSMISWIGVDTLAERVAYVVKMAKISPSTVNGKVIHLVRAPVSISDLFSQFLHGDACGTNDSNTSCTRHTKIKECEMVPFDEWKNAVRAYVNEETMSGKVRQTISGSAEKRIELAAKWRSLCSIPYGLDGLLGLCERPLESEMFGDNHESSVHDLLQLANTLLGVRRRGLEGH
jgi:hypothetical protein